MRLLASVLICSLFFATTAYSEPDKGASQELENMAEDLANCGGVYFAMAQELENINKPSAAQTFEDTGRGAYLAGAYAINATGKIPNWENAIRWAESKQETTKNYWLGLNELHTPTEENAFPKEFMDAMSFCTSLNPVQTEIVNLMKDQMYSLGDTLEQK